MQTFLGIILGGSFLAFLEFLIQRYDKKNDRFKTIEESIKALAEKVVQIDEKADRREAESRRVRILRFEDELRREVVHTKESYDQVMESDIPAYETYCLSHPDFKNNKTVATVEHITKVYNERLEKHDWL